MYETNEVKSYVRSRIVNGLIGIMAAYPLVMIVVSIFNGRVVIVWPIIVIVSLALWLLWIAARRGTFIAINLQRGVLRGSAFFLKPREIPIASITHVGTSGMFGGWTVMEVTYQRPDGSKKTVGFGAKETLDKVSFEQILDALVRINPNLRIPPELRSGSQN
jgi:hypothetical protein